MAQESNGGQDKMSASSTCFTPPAPPIASEPANQVPLAAATEPSIFTPVASLPEAEIATAENASTAAAAAAAATEHRQDYQPPQDFLPASESSSTAEIAAAEIATAESAAAQTPY